MHEATRSALSLLHRSSARIAAVLFLCGATLTAPALSQEEGQAPAPTEQVAPASKDAEYDRLADSLSQKMMSPFCPGRTLYACPSPKAGEWRADIRRWLSEGVSPEEIRKRLHDRIPKHDLLGVPETPLGWALPVLLVLTALGFLGFLLRYLLQSKSQSGTEEAPPPEAKQPSSRKDRDWDARLDQELETLEN